MMVTYTSDDEVLVCEVAHEKTMILEYFTEGGRDLDEYDREVVSGTVQITPRMLVSADQVIA